MINSPQIAPLPETTARPFWSVMIPVFNPDPVFLKQTITSVIRQNVNSLDMQIELVDDCSDKFNPEEIMTAFGDHRISYFRQETRQGIGGNWNTCITRAQGYWVHILHQDDLILPGFYEKLKTGIDQSAGIGAAFTSHYLMDENGKTEHLTRLRLQHPGIVKSWVEHIFTEQLIQTAAIVVRRSVYEKLGGFSLESRYTLDWDMWKKIALHYPVWHDPTPLACYRLHHKSTTSGLKRSANNLQEISQSIETSKKLLPENIAGKIYKKARRVYTMFGVEVALDLLLAEHDFAASVRQFKEAKKLGSWFQVILSVVKIAIRAVVKWIKEFVFKKYG